MLFLVPMLVKDLCKKNVRMRSINCCSAFHRLFSRLVKLVRAACQAVKQGPYRISSSLHQGVNKVPPQTTGGLTHRYLWGTTGTAPATCSSLTDGCRFPAELLPTIPFFSLQPAAGAAVFDGAGRPKSSLKMGKSRTI